MRNLSLSRDRKNDRIRVVYVITSIKNSGPNQVLNEMVSGIDNSAFEVYVVSMLEHNDMGTVALMHNFGATYSSLNLKRKRDIITLGPRFLKKFFAEIKPDIIHSHGILPDIAAMSARGNTPIISTVHSNMYEDYSFSFGRIKGYLFYRWHCWALHKFNRVVFCSKSAYEDTGNIFPNGCFIRNGISTASTASSSASTQLRKVLGIRQTDLVYIYVGSLSERKNILGLLEMFSRQHSKREHLIVLGDGSLRDECAGYVSDNIHVIGFKDNVSDYLSISDIYVSASKSEGMSISILEALSRGLYLLLSDIPSHREAIEIDKSVYVGEIFSEASFNEAKSGLSSRKGDRMIPTLYHQRYLSNEKMMSEYEQIYKDVTK